MLHDRYGFRHGVVTFCVMVRVLYIQSLLVVINHFFLLEKLFRCILLANLLFQLQIWHATGYLFEHMLASAWTGCFICFLNLFFRSCLQKQRETRATWVSTIGWGHEILNVYLASPKLSVSYLLTAGFKPHSSQQYIHGLRGSMSKVKCLASISQRQHVILAFCYFSRSCTLHMLASNHQGPTKRSTT